MLRYPALPGCVWEELGRTLGKPPDRRPCKLMHGACAGTLDKDSNRFYVTEPHSRWAIVKIMLGLDRNEELVTIETYNLCHLCGRCPFRQLFHYIVAYGASLG